jgi:hypothetical protein
VGTLPPAVLLKWFLSNNAWLVGQMLIHAAILLGAVLYT